ncbi:MULTISPECIES: hypothetical protein [Ignavibacterium]|jgi:hypothetical protein|uniref:hypothetical protein n=1 Tax=Ignavibacterium TaxID=795750 RepID=UPI0025C65874|nr:MULTISPECIES: hypothetical protein [Ignavibacterium]MBI5662195.1 hypothetical protein [Ignavibacterium album]
MYKFLIIVLLLEVSVYGKADSTKSEEKRINQYYSGKFGLYVPSKELNNGLILGIDGITEFNKFNFFLSGSIDLYFKKTFDIFSEPKPSVSDQTILIIPLHANFAYKLLDIPDAEAKFYIGIGGGYYLHFYNVQYRNSGGIIGGVFDKSATKNGGNVFFTVSGRILIGKIFIEPRFYLAGESSGSIETYNYKIDPSGFAITLGFQY